MWGSVEEGGQGSAGECGVVQLTRLAYAESGVALGIINNIQEDGMG